MLYIVDVLAAYSLSLVLVWMEIEYTRTRIKDKISVEQIVYAN